MRDDERSDPNSVSLSLSLSLGTGKAMDCVNINGVNAPKRSGIPESESMIINGLNAINGINTTSFNEENGCDPIYHGNASYATRWPLIARDGIKDGPNSMKPEEELRDLRRDLIEPLKVSFDIGFKVGSSRKKRKGRKSKSSRNSERKKKRSSSTALVQEHRSRTSRRRERRKKKDGTSRKERRSKSGRRRRSKSKRLRTSSSSKERAHGVDAEKLRNLHIDVSAAFDLDRNTASKKKKERKHRKSCALSTGSKTKNKEPKARKSCPHSLYPLHSVSPQSVPSYSPVPSTSNLCDAEYAAFCSSYFVGKPLGRRHAEWTQVSIPPPPMKKRLSLELI